MSFLFTIWLLAVLVVITLSCVAFFRVRHTVVGREMSHVPQSIGEFFVDQLHEIYYRVVMSAHQVKPHVRRIGVVVLSCTKRGHDLFIERVFGRIELKRGNSISFFLKRIAEHKQMHHRDRL